MPERSGPNLVVYLPNGSISHPLDVATEEQVKSRFELVGISRDLWVVEEAE